MTGAANVADDFADDFVDVLIWLLSDSERTDRNPRSKSALGVDSLRGHSQTFFREIRIAAGMAASLSFVPVVVRRSKMLKTPGAETEVRLLSTDELLSLVYSELRQLAAARLTTEPSGQTLQPTALVHEVYLRLTASRSESLWNSRAHFFAAAAEAMRRILIDRARAKACQKRGGDYDRIDLIDPVDSRTLSPLELIDLDNALAKLELVNARQARIVKLRFFAGLTNDQVAKALGVSVSTAENDWAYARCWLRVEMSR